jgi:hypothetical protein
MIDELQYKLIPIVTEKLIFKVTQKSPRFKDPNQPNIFILILDSLRSSHPKFLVVYRS